MTKITYLTNPAKELYLSLSLYSVGNFQYVRFIAVFLSPFFFGFWIGRTISDELKSMGCESEYKIFLKKEKIEILTLMQALIKNGQS